MTNPQLVRQALEGETPKWCQHITFWWRPAAEMDGQKFGPQGGWSFPSNEAPCGLTDTIAKWKFCPICGEPNPYTTVRSRKPSQVARSGNLIEHDIEFHLKSAWSDFVALDQTHPQHPRLFLDGIHACQQVMMWREMQRLKPEKYLSFVEVAPPIGLDKEQTPE